MLQEYGHLDVSSILELMKKVKLPTTVESLQAQLSKECKEHEAELKSSRRSWTRRNSVALPTLQ